MAIVSDGSATIHQFPAGGRNVGRRRFEQPATVSDIRLAPVAMTVDYSSWYHDEAVREEQAPHS